MDLQRRGCVHSGGVTETMCCSQNLFRVCCLASAAPSNEDAMVWGLVAMPNDARKSEKVSQWLSERIKILLSEASKPA